MVTTNSKVNLPLKDRFQTLLPVRSTINYVEWKMFIFNKESFVKYFHVNCFYTPYLPNHIHPGVSSATACVGGVGWGSDSTHEFSQ